MPFRKLFTVLVLALPVLITAFAVLMAAGLLAEGLGDAGGVRLLRMLGVGCLIVLAVDVLLLVGALGLKELEERSEAEPPAPDEEP